MQVTAGAVSNVLPVSPATETGTVLLKDGRTLCFDAVGDRAGPPILFFHGYPDCRLLRGPDQATASTGARLVAFDRPGFGGSSRHPIRTLSGIARDVEELADSLGLGRFGVIGHSGGAPYALASAAALPDRVGAVGLLAPATPTDMADSDHLLNPMIRLIRDGLATDRDATAAAGRAIVASWAADIDAYVDMMTSATQSEADRALLENEHGHFLAVARTAFANGPDGVADEPPLIFGPWDFDWQAVAAPTAIWYGAQDHDISPELGQVMARAMRTSDFRCFAGVGHLIQRTEYWEAMLTWVKEQL